MDWSVCCLLTVYKLKKKAMMDQTSIKALKHMPILHWESPERGAGVKVYMCGTANFLVQL